MDKILSPIKGRVLQFIEIKKITKESFFNATGIARSNFSGPNAKSELGGDKIAKILNNYPEINPAWLILGDGEMLNTGTISQTVSGNKNNVAGMGSVNTGVPASLHEKALNEIAEQRKLAERSQTQIDRLLDIIENMQKINKK